MHTIAAAATNVGEIAFTSTSGNNAIFTINTDGTNLTNISNDFGNNDVGPHWSQDGARLDWTTTRFFNTNQVVTANADGSSLVDISSQGNEGGGGWSPDGTKILFVLASYPDNQIGVMNATGGSEVMLTSSGTDGPNNGFPSWSPDGSRILFCHRTNGTNYDIEIMNADGTGKTLLTSSLAEDCDPSFSPDGSKIYFESTRNGAAHVFVMNADGSGQTDFTAPTNETDSEPTVSPDGSQLAYTCSVDGNTHICIMNSDGTNRRVLTSVGYDWHPAWRPSSTSPPPPLRHVALGDSYSAGEGAPSGPNGGFVVRGDDTSISSDKCHRSPASYAETVAFSQSVSRTFVACAGAVVDDFLNSNHNNPVEPPQEIALGAQTDAVTITMGGNDIAFPDLIGYCATASNCQNDMTTLGGGVDVVMDNIDRLYPRLVELYDEIRADTAFHAAVWVIGYPKIFDPTQTCSNNLGIEPAEMTWANKVVDHLDNVIGAAAQAAGVNFVDDRAWFASHEICTGSPWANGIDPIHLEYSFHPNVAGQQAIATRLSGEPTWPLGISPPTGFSPPSAPVTNVSLAGLGRQGQTVSNVALGVSIVGGVATRVVKGVVHLGQSAWRGTVGGVKRVYHLFVHSNAIDLGYVTPDDNGDLNINVTIPDPLDTGTHSLTLQTGDPTDGQFLAATVELPPDITSTEDSTDTVLGQPVTLTTRVAANDAALPAPTGSVLFADGTTNLGTVSLAADGTASLTTTGLAVGLHDLQASYSGDDHYTATAADIGAHTVSSPTTPDPPTGLVATRGNRSASVSFSPPASDGGSAIFGYTATASPGGASVTVDGSHTSATVTGLTNGTSYSLTVTATNGVGTGAPSSASNAVVPADVPDAPTIGTATAGNGSALVSWTAPADNGSAISGYTVTASPGGASAAVDGSHTSATVTGLTNGTSYTLAVTATNGVGNGAASSASNAVIPADVPDAPTIGTATRGNGSASVSWSAPADNGSAISGYTVTASPGGASVAVDGSHTSATVTGLTNGTSYTLTVTATNGVGTGAASSASNAVVPATVPGAPTIGTFLVTGTTGSVAFTAPASNGGSPITGYTATCTSSNLGVTRTAIRTLSPISVLALTSGKTYTCTVKATNAVGTGLASAAAAAKTVPVVPGAPTNVVAVPGGGQASVSWTATTTNGGSPLTSYVVTPYLGTLAQTPLAKSVGPSVLSATMTGLTNGTTYTFRVVAKNLVGSGPAAVSPPVAVGAPVAPVVTAVGSSTSAALSWTAPANSGSAITSYVVTTYLGAVLQSAKTHTLTCTQPCSPARTWTVTGLTNGSLYTFRVVAVNARGTGPAGATTIKVGAATLPSVPTGVHATAGAGSATVSWVVPANGSATITAYVITPFKVGVAQPVITVVGTVASRLITGLTAGQSYTFKVAARSVVGTGLSSAGSSAVMPT